MKLKEALPVASAVTQFTEMIVCIHPHPCVRIYLCTISTRRMAMVFMRWILVSVPCHLIPSRSVQWHYFLRHTPYLIIIRLYFKECLWNQHLPTHYLPTARLPRHVDQFICSYDVYKDERYRYIPMGNRISKSVTAMYNQSTKSSLYVDILHGCSLLLQRWSSWSSTWSLYSVWL